MEIIRNINKTDNALETCSCGNWLHHWEKFSRRKATICSVFSCKQDHNLAGAHVQKFSTYNTDWYIIPLCRYHNLNKGEMLTKEGTVFIPADRKDTCGK